MHNACEVAYPRHPGENFLQYEERIGVEVIETWYAMQGYWRNHEFLLLEEFQVLLKTSPKRTLDQLEVHLKAAKLGLVHSDDVVERVDRLVQAIALLTPPVIAA